MGFFQRFLGNSDKNAVEPAPLYATPPPRAISYDQGLIEVLKRDHVALDALFRRIGEVHKSGTMEELRAALADFKSRFEAHLLTENVRFYTFLEQSLNGDPHNIDVMREFRRDMNAIARSVVTFVKRYQSSALDVSERRQFASEYEAVGNVLARRLHNEEDSLYPLYSPQ